MNREIKFRGYSEELKSFVYGFYQEVDIEGIGYSYIFWQGNTTQVRADSVAQFTGLYDKNGNEIYECDIVDFGNSNPTYVVFENGCFSIFGEPLGWDFTPDYDNDYKPQKTDLKYCEVVGNIYENPYLLK